MSARREAIRRYPALGFLVVAGVLAVMLPSALIVPTSGPPTLAELAPVPGDGEGSGDLDRLGSGSSGDVGSGGATDGGAAPPAPAADPGRPSSTLKRCVGQPPRQTEDPMSPPCVAFFEGDNGGATAPGVTRDEIVVVVHRGGSTRPRTLDLSSEETDSDPQVANFDNVVRAFARHFNDRYQTYGRRVHFYAYSGHSSSDKNADVQADLQDLKRLRAFAILPVGLNDAALLAPRFAKAGYFSVGYAAYRRAEYEEVAPRLVTYAPDLEDEARMIGSFVCRKLAGRVARYAGNPQDAASVRRFGIVYQGRIETPQLRQTAELVAADIRRRCDVEAPVRGTRPGNDGLGDYPVILGEMRAAGVTSLIGFGDSAGNSFYAAAGQQLGYYPEWILPGTPLIQGSDQYNIARQHQPVFWRQTFGLTFDRLRVRREQQYWYRAFREACPTCTDLEDYRLAKLYDQLTLLFWGVQAAGPRLTPENIDRGLHAIRPRASANPDAPAAYFSPGNYSWVKDAMAIWWDPTGQPPGDDPGGCYRLPHEGRRRREGEWPRGDDDVRGPGPCQGLAR